MAEKNCFKDVHNYDGQYCKGTLMKAAQELSNAVNRNKKQVWRTIEAKTGVYHRNPKDKWGQHSSYFSHADLPENKQSEGTYNSVFGYNDSGIVCDDEVAGPSTPVLSEYPMNNRLRYHI